MRIAVASCLALLGLTTQAVAQAVGNANNVILITLDGLRWEELFTGVDSTLLVNKRYTSEFDEMNLRFWRDAPSDRRKALMPFFWNTIATEGALFGNRTLGCEAEVTNRRVFSYPGYNEILTGSADSTITSNDKIPNRNETVLEFVNKQSGFEGKVAAFGSWDVFPYIVNEERSRVPVNAGFEAASGPDLTPRESFLNEIQEQTPSPWSTVRLDVFTHQFAMEHLKTHRPRLLYIAYGETDDFAHNGDFDQYIRSAHRTDQFIADIWQWVQNDPEYKDRTTVLITTDHGRGPGDQWTGHGIQIPGATAIWVAMLGSGVHHLGEVESCSVFQNQMARTTAVLLGLDFGGQSAGPVLPGLRP